MTKEMNFPSRSRTAACVDSVYKSSKVKLECSKTHTGTVTICKKGGNALRGYDAISKNNAYSKIHSTVKFDSYTSTASTARNIKQNKN